jgi:3-oxocholest-4-en-26-oate---CoA ligase
VSLGADPEGTTPTPDELSVWVGELIASYKRPRRVVVVDQVQRTTVGKADYAWARTVLS